MFVKSSKELYGWDRFSKVTLVLGIFLIVARSWILAAVLIIYSIWRSRSTNMSGRNNEKFVYENIQRNFYYKIKDFRQSFKQNIKKIKPLEQFKEKRNYMITYCPKCRQKLRVPKRKGKIIVTCSKCSSEFRLRT
ncbi:zinc-ribbon domain-containing protein [Clostridium estertheticum]|uniref:zinc-ribbon domain-containing protein n=1 Tax=Clostridium estertheticum TaxID=238834 RepID=UPI001CF1F8EA|nr:zinc-ribbon domain-containing protein [Clostridium estertheticum]MCB2307488.1 zinc-ribbon domain-containing protein [Clostridium estertheticum]MCB2345745.1 zinc-ribbon domain-containing protein [Clostridium estertheticum]MCB2350977.1 zinc-ribbon domain-containing protein [Clostridium estertheticum]WAG47849.1 zinc-ribbon domain-containing protein [Clostridium estertheticum]